ncbi:MAG: uroporphyrinogen-III C-methyltransferase [Deltaproteobacteria bacterium]|nr:uroporphyrinogen-III C-methyltransferase [Deltaproteobacteria bacterium]
MSAPGMVFLVGAGPGDPGLMTLRGAELLRRADVVIHDGLVHPALLDLIPPGSERIYAGKKHSELGLPLTQEEIAALLVEKAKGGRTVVRLKGGDPFIFGRGGEEADFLRTHGIPFEVVPGVTAATAVAAYAGIPLTHRDLATTVALAAGQEAEGKPSSSIDWAGLARVDTLVLFMAVKSLASCAAKLMAAGRAASTPVAVIRWGTTAGQRTLTGTLENISARVEAEGLRPPALVVIGNVVSLRDRLTWYEHRPLFGLRVLVPRAKEQAHGLACALSELGAEPIITEVTRVLDGDLAGMERELRRFPGGFDWVAFASATAVDRTMGVLDRLGLDVRVLAGARVAVVGHATAAALRKHGLRADLVPDVQDGTGLASAIRDVHGDFRGVRVLLPRAEGGREELAVDLEAHGAQVTTVAVYRTVPVPGAELAGLLHRLHSAEIEVLTFFAPSQVDAVSLALGQHAGEILSKARVIAAIGPTTANALRARGARVDLVPNAPSSEALASSLVTYFKEKS